MEFWGVEVKPGESFKVKPDVNKLIHISQAALGEVKKGKEAFSVPLRLKIDDVEFVLGTLSAEGRPHLTFDLVFERDFELSHGWKNGSVYFCGYTADNPSAHEEYDSDSVELSDDDEDHMLDTTENGKLEPNVGEVKPAKFKATPVKPESSTKPKVTLVEPKKDEESDDDDNDDDDEMDGETDDDSDDILLDALDDENPIDHCGNGEGEDADEGSDEEPLVKRNPVASRAVYSEEEDEQEEEGYSGGEALNLGHVKFGHADFAPIDIYSNVCYPASQAGQDMLPRDAKHEGEDLPQDVIASESQTHSVDDSGRAVERERDTRITEEVLPLVVTPAAVNPRPTPPILDMKNVKLATLGAVSNFPAGVGAEFTRWGSYHVNAEFVDILNKIVEQYPDTLTGLTARSSLVRSGCLCFLGSTVADFLGVPTASMTEKDLMDCQQVLADLRDMGFQIDWLEQRLEAAKLVLNDDPKYNNFLDVSRARTNQRAKVASLEKSLVDMEEALGKEKSFLVGIDCEYEIVVRELEQLHGPGVVELSVGNLGDDLLSDFV